MQLCHILTQWMYSGGLTEYINVSTTIAKTIFLFMFYQDVISKMLMTNSDDRNYAWKLCTSVKQSSYQRDLSKSVKSKFLTNSSVVFF